MKTRFSTLDLMAILPQLRLKLIGMRVTQVYDIDNKTYLFKLAKSLSTVTTAGEVAGEETNKQMLLIESGIRIHTTDFDWPKNTNPSGFTMKLRKHLKNKRLEAIEQLGVDRVVRLQFGTNEVAFHIFLELYDRGNIVITDHQFVILNILRPRIVGTDDADVKLMVREKYPIETASATEFVVLSEDKIKEMISQAKDGDNLKKILNPRVIYGASLIEHTMIDVSFDANAKLKKDNVDGDVVKIREALEKAHEIMKNISQVNKGYIIQKVEKRIGESVDNKSGGSDVITYLEFHPYLFNQHQNPKDLKLNFTEIDSFDKTVDLFFSSIEGQRIDSKALQQEKDAIKKLDNIKKDHARRLEDLMKLQEIDTAKARLIELNCDLVDKALLVIRSAIANQISWKEIHELIREAQQQGDPVASLIKGLKLEKNHFTMKLSDPYEDEDTGQLIDIDLDLSAYANARKYYDMKRTAAKKEQKTIESSEKAFKNAEKKTMQTLKEVAIKTTITKARKTYWFEKFFWFISSENYLVIGGRDAQQNELIVKRYMKPNDVYVHADLHGATSVVVKNNDPSLPIPPKTLHEAGAMAICYSVAWDAKIVTSAWWVNPSQVSKTAPTGEYLTVGSFMIRGKKNYLPLCHLVMGFGFLFKLDDESVERHKDERRIRMASESEADDSILDDKADVEIHVSDNNDSDSDNDAPHFPDTRTRVASLGTNDGDEQHQDDDVKIYLGDDKPIIIKSQEPRVKQQQGKKHEKQVQAPKQDTEMEDEKESNDKPKQLKRGQKSKLKKQKEKYKDQDEDERQLKMAILGSAGTKGGDKAKQTKKGKQSKTDQPKPSAPLNEKHHKVKLQLQKIAQNSNNDTNNEQVIDDCSTTMKDMKLVENETKKVEEINMETAVPDEANDEDADADEDDDAPKIQSSDTKILESLTGQPNVDDVLLFCIPVCAPYSAMQSYKYKVKVLPGSNRRGKAAKTSLQLFLHDKTATTRERDLFKSVKDQDIARNLPSKVKIAASNLNVVKKKK